jgi:hypothetical protein
VAKEVDPFARAIHALCVAAGAECPEAAARKAANTSLKRAAEISGRRRRNLTLAEAERMCRNRC